MDGDAGVARAQDCVDPVCAADGRATRTRIPLVAVRGRVVEVGTPSTLQQFAADGGLVAELTRGAREQGLREDRVLGTYSDVCGRVGVGGLGPDPESTVGQRLDVLERQPADVDQVSRLLDLEPHQVDQVGAAADEFRAGPTHRRDGPPRIGRAFVGEGLHVRPPATSRIAATIFG
jgi:hypothetical protein